MLPFLRIVPIGGVCLTALVLVLALEPPGKPPRVVSPDMELARGPLIDRTAHPEWPQMLVRAAYMRADEILKLRDLPNTPTRVAPVVLPPQRPAVPAAKPAAAADTAPQPQASQTEGAPQPAVRAASAPDAPVIAPVKPAPVTAASATVAPAPAESAAQASPSTEAALDKDQSVSGSMPAQSSPAAAKVDGAAKTPPDNKAATQTAATVTAPADIAATTADALSLPATTDAVPVPEPRPTKMAALPTERAATEPTSDDVTGAVADSSGATIPVDIGEASSTELPIVLPRERPAILRIRDRAEPRRRAVRPRHTRAKAAPKPKPKLPSNVQPASQVNLFDQLFDDKNAANRKAPTVTARGARTATTRTPTAASNLSPPPPYYPFDQH